MAADSVGLGLAGRRQVGEAGILELAGNRRLDAVEAAVERAVSVSATPVAVGAGVRESDRPLDSLDDLAQVDKAIESYEAALGIDSQLAAAHNNLAAAHFRQGNVEKAITESQRAIELEPARASYHANYAVLMYSTDDFESARQYLEIALRLEPGNQAAIDLLKLLPVAGSG